MKRKILVLIGIAVCTVLLTSPVLASAGYSQIYGNANEDDVLDMRDVTYIKLVIFGKKPATAFADANYDGKISMLDIGQTKLIILGKEKELTLVDMADRTVTLYRPIERIVLCDILNGIRTLVTLGAEDKIVAINEDVKRAGYVRLIDPEPSSWWTPLQVAAPELKDLPTVGPCEIPSMETIVSLEPDVVFTYSAIPDDGKTLQEKIGIPVISTTCSGTNFLATDFGLYRLIGTLVGKEERAEELISYFNEKLAKVTEVTSEIPEDEKPKVYLTFWRSITRTPGPYDPLDLAGGRNVAKEIMSGSITVSKEQVIAWNPDIILIHRVPTSKSHVWGCTIEDILTDPDLQTVNAVKNENVNYTQGFCFGWDPATGITETFYMAKLCHPDKFKDLDIEKENNEILERFYGVDGLYTEVAERCEFYRWD